ncbi:MAG: O-antigen ligase family protein [Chloroflexi bacterium]|nr:O-antigen ligase family protein [Chloroflexota bacterium]
MSIRALPRWRPSPAPWLDATRLGPAWHSLRRKLRAAARAAGDLLLRYELAYALPAIVLLVLALDGQLVDAWNFKRLGGDWWHALRLDRGNPLLPLTIGLPLVPWIVRAVRSGPLAITTGPDLALFLYLAGAQLGFTQTVDFAGSKTRLLGIVGATYLYYLISHTTGDVRTVRRWLWAVLGACLAGALLTLSLMGFQLPEVYAQYGPAELVNHLIAPLRPFALGPVDHWLFFVTSQRLPIHPNVLADFLLVVGLMATTLAVPLTPGPSPTGGEGSRLERGASTARQMGFVTLSAGEVPRGPSPALRATSAERLLPTNTTPKPRWNPQAASLCTLHFALCTWFRGRLGWLALAAVAIVLLVSTGSRGGLLGLLGGGAALLALTRPRWLIPLVPATLLAAVLFAVPMAKTRDALGALQRGDVPRAVQVLQAPSGHYRTDATQAIGPRLRVWSSYWSLLRDKPIAGEGLGLQSVATSFSQRYGIHLYYSESHSHSVLLQTYLEQTVLGLAGLLLLLYAAGCAVRSAKPALSPSAALRIHYAEGCKAQSAKGPTAATAGPGFGAWHLARDTSEIAVASLVAIAGLLAHALVDINLNTNIITALLFALASLTLRASQLGEQQAVSSGQFDEPDLRASVGGRRLPVTYPRAAAWLVAALLLLVTLLSLLPPPYAPYLQLR